MEYDRKLRVGEDGVSDVRVDDLAVAEGSKRAVVEPAVREVENLEVRAEVLRQLHVSVERVSESSCCGDSCTYV